MRTYPVLMELLCSYEHFKSSVFISHSSVNRHFLVSSVCHPFMSRRLSLLCVTAVLTPWMMKAPDLKCSYEHKSSMSIGYVPKVNNIGRI
jgi:hypothetical protein